MCNVGPNESNLDAILEAMQDQKLHTTTQFQCCIALRNFARQSDHNKSLLGKSKAPALVLEAMKHHISHDIVQEYGCRFLVNLHFAKDKQHFLWLGTSEAPALVMQAMQNHASCAGVQESGCRALRELARNRVSLGTPEAAALVMQAMRNHASSACVQTLGCMALAEFAQNNILVGSPEALALITQAIQSHPSLLLESCEWSPLRTLHALGWRYAFRVATESTFKKYDETQMHGDLLGFELVDPIYFRANATWADFQKVLHERFGIIPAQQRLWKWTQRTNNTYRPDTPFGPTGSQNKFTLLKDVLQQVLSFGSECAVDVFLETPCAHRPDTLLRDLPSRDCVFLLFKFYNSTTAKLSYVGHAAAPLSSTSTDLLPLLNGFINRQLDLPLLLYEEVTPTQLDSVSNMNKTLAELRLQHGDIVVYQLALNPGHNFSASPSLSIYQDLPLPNNNPIPLAPRAAPGTVCPNPHEVGHTGSIEVLLALSPAVPEHQVPFGDDKEHALKANQSSAILQSVSGDVWPQIASFLPSQSLLCVIHVCHYFRTVLPVQYRVTCDSKPALERMAGLAGIVRSLHLCYTAGEESRLANMIFSLKKMNAAELQTLIFDYRGCEFTTQGAEALIRDKNVESLQKLVLKYCFFDFGV